MSITEKLKSGTSSISKSWSPRRRDRNPCTSTETRVPLSSRSSYLWMRSSRGRDVEIWDMSPGTIQLVNNRFKQALDCCTYRLANRSLKYDGKVATNVAEWAERLLTPMRCQNPTCLMHLTAYPLSTFCLPLSLRLMQAKSTKKQRCCCLASPCRILSSPHSLRNHVWTQLHRQTRLWQEKKFEIPTRKRWTASTKQASPMMSTLRQMTRKRATFNRRLFC